jgi:hypothetical protein
MCDQQVDNNNNKQAKHLDENTSMNRQSVNWLGGRQATQKHLGRIGLMN